jgi:hypothetical protein
MARSGQRSVGSFWELSNKVADLYAPRRPQPSAAKWAIDEDGLPRLDRAVLC